MAELNEGATAHVELVAKTDDATTIAISGEIDVSNDAAVWQAVSASLDPVPPCIVFDVRDLTFMDSSGIAVLLRAAKSVARVEVHHPTRAVRRIIETTGIDRVLHLVEP
jgi:stage II sporulation protein AA (anti-sigma F factor antagonist)